MGGPHECSSPNSHWCPTLRPNSRHTCDKLVVAWTDWCKCVGDVGVVGVCGVIWQPIEDAPRTGKYIIVGDGVCLPDIVVWHSCRPERVINGNIHLSVPEGWFTVNQSRSRLCGKATMWTPIPEYP